MIDWLKRDPRAEPVVEIGGRKLPIVVRRLAQARRMTLRLAPDGTEVRVSIPRWGRTAEALAFAHSRGDWLASQLASFPIKRPPAPGEMIAYRGQNLEIAHDPAAPRKVILAGDTLRLGGPADSLAARLRRWLENEARARLAEDLAFYSARAGLSAPTLALSNARRRWGSCARDGAIRINWRLIMAPDLVRRSVVAHEIAHLVHFDHSPRFHAFLADIYEGEVADADRWLKAHGRKLYAGFG